MSHVASALSSRARLRVRAGIWLGLWIWLISVGAVATESGSPLRVGISAYRPSPVVSAEFQPVADALAQALGRPVELRILPPMVLAEAYASRQLDLMFGGSQLHLTLQRRLPLPAPIATLRREYRGQPLTRLAAVLLIRSDAIAPADLAQLGERRMAVPEPLAPDGGEELARQLEIRGLPPVPAHRLIWTPDHDGAIRLLLGGQADIALIRTGVMESLIDAGELATGQLQVIAPRRSADFPLAHSTRPLPEWIALPGPHLDLDQRRGLSVALLSLSLPERPVGGQPIAGFDPPADYSAARLAEVPVPPAQSTALPTLTLLTIVSLLLLGLIGLAIRYRRLGHRLGDADADRRQLRALLDALPVGIWLRDRDGRLRDVNARVLDTLGIGRDARVGGLDYARLFPESVAGQLTEADAETLRSGRPRHRRLRLATPDGRLHELELVQARTLDAEGQPDGVCSVAIERSEDAAADRTALLTEYEHLLGRLSGELASVDNRSVDIAVHRALAAVGTTCAVGRAYLFLFNRDGTHADNTHEWCAAGVEPQIGRLQDLPMTQFPWLLAALKARETLAIGDVAQLPPSAAAEREMLAAQHIRSALIVPMLAGERLVGFIGLDDTHGSRRWHSAEQSLLRVIGEMLVHALLRLRAEQSHSESVSYLQALLGALPDLLFVIDADGHYLDIHARDRSKLTQPDGDSIGKRIRDTVPAALADLTEAALARIFGGSTLERFDYTLTLGGRELAFAAEMVPLDGGRVLAICRDITERRQTELALASSEARYRALVEHSQSLIFQLDGEHRLRFLSRSAQFLLGQLPAALIGQRLVDLVEPEDQPLLRDYLGRLVERPVSAEADPALDQGIELRVRQPDGALRWLHVVMTPLAASGTGDTGLVGNAVDNSGRTEARQQLSALAAQLQAVIDGVPSYIFAKDADGHYVLANRACAEAVGRTTAEIVGLTDIDLHADATLAEGYRATDLQAIDSEQVVIAREPVVHADGRVVWCQTVKRRWQIPGDPRPGVLGVATDISERILNEDQLRHESALTALLVRLALTYIDLPAAELSDTIRQSVQELARFVGADRGYLFRYEHPTASLSNTVEWCADGVEPQIQRLQQMPFDAFAELTERHFRGAVVELPDLALLRDAATRQHLQAQGICSLLSVPLMRGEDCIGFVGFDWVRGTHTCTTGEIQLLTVFAQMLVNAQFHADTADALDQQRQRLELVVEGTAAGTWIWWPQTGALEINERWAGILGYTTAELSPVDFQTWRRLSREDDLAVAERALATHAAGQTPIYEARVRMRHKEGRWIWVLTRGRTVRRDDAGQVLIYAGTHQDITAQVEAEESLRLAASVFTHSHEGILITDAEVRIVEVNEAFSRITGLQRDEVLGQNPRILKSGRHGPEFYRALWDSLNAHGFWAGEIWNRRRNGEYYAEFLTISVVRDPAGQVLNYVALFSDITAQKQYQQRLERIAHYDPLTGLPNRALLADRLRQAMAQARRRRQQVAVAFIDLDGFKVINDTHGHEIGDQFLREVGQRMRRTLREWDTVSRLGGDEFVAVMIDLPDREALTRLLQRLSDAMAHPLQVGPLQLPLSASIGVSFYPQSEELDAEQLLRQADQAMYQAKHAGKRQTRFFDAALDLSHRDRIDWLARIREGLAQGEFQLYYQPIVDLRLGRIDRVEALLRWNHPERGQLTPQDFLPVVEGDVLTPLLGDWVLERALADRQRWQAEGVSLTVSVNIAGGHLLRGDFVAGLQNRLGPQTPQECPLILEVVESSVIDDLPRAVTIIEDCRTLGVDVSLDDFGTGYSSLGDLKQLPLIDLKIDQRFVRDLQVDPDNLAIVDGILALSRAYGLGVIAEGVETDEQAELLLDFGCTRLQGYALARPMPAESLPEWLRRWTPDPAWLARPALRRGLLPLRFAEAEYRGWVCDLLARFDHASGPAPDPDLHPCRFGRWLALLDQLELPPDWRQALHAAHAQLHRQSQALCDEPAARETHLQALETVSDQLRACLRAGESSVAPTIDLPSLPASRR